MMMDKELRVALSAYVIARREAGYDNTESFQLYGVVTPDGGTQWLQAGPYAGMSLN